MALDLNAITPPTPAGTKARGRFSVGRIVAGLLLLAAVGGPTLAWMYGASLRQVWAKPPTALETLDVVQGPLAVVVVETGTVESAANTTVRCQVEALTGMVGGSSTTPTRAVTTTTSAATTSDNGAGKAAADKATAQKAASKKAAKKASRKAESAGATASSSSSSGGGLKSSSSSNSSGSGVSDTGSKGSKSSSASSENTQTAITQVPSIRSFSYDVKAYTSLQTAKRTVTTTTKAASSSGGAAGGGNRGGGGNSNEKAGSTRIIMIREEGTTVAAGDVVCEFDSAAFKDAVLAQRIRTDTARASMIQALSILDVNRISLEEYRDGIYTQDLQLVRQYLTTCRAEEVRAKNNVSWSQGVLDKNFRAPQQHQAEVLSLQRAEIALVVAELMEKRLQEATGPKLIKSLEAKLQANRADALALEAAYGIEADRLKRLQKMVENCVLRAPHEGTVVYSMPASNGWRPSTPSIMEGATVREGQPIFELPDPKRMRIRAKINESKVSSIHFGQRVSIRVDAFPDRQLSGTVGDVTLIPAPAAGPGSDVKIYFANITLNDGNYQGLRPGLSAEVSFLIDDRPEVTQVPIQAIRWVGGLAYAALSTSADRSQFRWQPIETGAMNANFVEVLRGVKVGERIVARPDALPAPLPAVSPADPLPTLQVAQPSAGSPQG